MSGLPIPDVKKIIIYLDEHAAHGCGHIGIIFCYTDQSAELVYQSAQNPQDRIFRLLLLKQPVRVIKKRTASFRYIRQLTDSTMFFSLQTKFGNEIRSGVEEYIRCNRPYNSLVNNCCHFIDFILAPAVDIKKRLHIIPKKYYHRLRELNTA